jgi:hypothetical protein
MRVIPLSETTCTVAVSVAASTRPDGMWIAPTGAPGGDENAATTAPFASFASRGAPSTSSTSLSRSTTSSEPSPMRTRPRVRPSVRSRVPGGMTESFAAGWQLVSEEQASRPPVLSFAARATLSTLPAQPTTAGPASFAPELLQPRRGAKASATVATAQTPYEPSRRRTMRIARSPW